MRTSLAAVLLIGLMVSCVSAPVAGPPPDWILNTPQPDSQNTFFVASSPIADGDVGSATEDASNILISQIIRYMGVEVDVNTSGEARGSLDSYSAEVTAVVTQRGSGRVAGFSIKERYVYTDASGTRFVYVLAQYLTADLEREKARIQALFIERTDAVAIPERNGDAAAGAGRWFEAIKFYVEAAAAAAGSNIDNAQIKAERNVNKARQLLGRLNLARLDFPAEAALGTAFSAPFRARLSYGEGTSAPGIPNAEVIVRYQRVQNNGRSISRSERVTSDANGVISFSPPPPDAVGRLRITFELNLESTRELIDSFPARFADYASALIDDMSRRAVTFEYNVVSMARSVPTGLAIIDLTDAGLAAATSYGQGSLFETLSRERFAVSLAPLAADLIVSQNDASIQQAAQVAGRAAGLQRVIYGTVIVESVVQDGSMWKATARMIVRCIDLASGRMLYSVEKTALAIAATQDQARRAAVSNVARDTVARDLMANLP